MYDDIWDKEPVMNLRMWREIEAIVDDVGEILPQLCTISHESRSVVQRVATLDGSVIPRSPRKSVFSDFSQGSLID
jgi:hypothetical protein